MTTERELTKEEYALLLKECKILDCNDPLCKCKDEYYIKNNNEVWHKHYSNYADNYPVFDKFRCTL
jgi:hypothetical protein